MARIGRSNPVQPFASHGFLGNVPANGTLPAQTVVVEPDDRRRKTPPLQAVVIVGTFVAPVVAAPSAPTVIERVDQRARRLPQDPVAISAALLATSAPTVTPPAPFIVPIEERRRFLAALPPDIGVGFDDVVPPVPNVVEPTSKRRLLLDPFSTNPAELAVTPPATLPPAPFVVPIDQRGRFLVVLPSTGQHGFVDPGPAAVGTTPPPAQSLDRADQRVRYKPLDPLVLSGVLAPDPAPTPPALGAVQDMAPFISNW